MATIFNVQKDGHWEIYSACLEILVSEIYINLWFALFTSLNLDFSEKFVNFMFV